VIVCSIFINKS